MRFVLTIPVVLIALGVMAAAMVIEAPKIEARIADQAATALDELGFTAQIDGRDATLIGIARDEDHRDTGLIRLAAIDEVDILRDHTVMISNDGPHAFSAARMASGEMFLHGVLPDQETRDVLISGLETAGLGPVRDFTRVVAGEPDGWSDSVVAATLALEALEQGQAFIVDDEVTINGLYSESKSQTAFSRLSTPGWRVFLSIDQRDVVEALRAQAEALRADLLDMSDALDTQTTEAAIHAEEMASEIDIARERIATLEALLGEEARDAEDTVSSPEPEQTPAQSDTETEAPESEAATEQTTDLDQ
ncbi:MAG: hypothetical protein AAFV19_00775 [Pseudomonadota bacterium]